MYKHILVPVDNSKLSLKALDTAAELAKSLGAKITAVTVSPSYPTIVAGDGYMVEPIAPSEWDKITARHAEKVRKDVDKRAKAKSVSMQFVAATVDQPYLGIIETAKKKKCDLIVMASHGRRGLSALLLGSETTKVLTHSKLPVLVCR
jgi:nucleotide-binding universal stress UspA family protein